MRKLLVIAILVLFLRIPAALAQESIRIDITPQPCANRAGCPIDLVPVYEARGEACVTDIAAFAAHPTSNHYWVEDPKITDQGKADERARQFIYWTLSTRSLDDSPVLKNVWRLTSNITYFLVLFVAAMLGIGLIVGQRLRFETKVKIWPAVMKIVMVLIYVAFSASIIILLIQLSEILMKFFLETLGGKDFFNIYFSTDQQDQINQQGNTGAGQAGAAATGQSESNYIGFVGCRDLNIRVQESVQAEIFLFKATNITYYVMGTMILLRKVLLWFLLFVAPFAAVLIPFVFIRNVAWIWLGVFFQWLFYGPLFALFLGATATIWKNGIPFLFDFSRVDKLVGYVYPTAINITYGGPAQRLGALNNGNYVDTFAEYVITLIMLWAAIVFPWWLLRIFRDYCCDYLMAMKNILLNMYDQMRVSSGPLGPSPTQPGSSRTTSTSQNIVNKTYNNMPTERRLETMEEIRNTTTQNILKNVAVSAPKLVDIAKYETNTTTQNVANKNMEYLKNPMKADTPVERQKYMNIRTELLNRALKEDKLAKQVLSSVSTSFVDQRENKTAMSNQVFNAMSKSIDNSQQVRENIARTVVSKVANQQFDQVVKQSNANKETVINTVLENTPTNRSISSVVQVPQQTVNNVTTAITNSVNNMSTINNIAQNSKVDSNSVQQIYEAYQQNSTQSPTQIFQTVANNQSVTNALQNSLTTNESAINQVSSATNMSTSDVHKIVNEMSNVSSTPISESTVIQNIARETNVEQSKVQEVVSQIKSQEQQGQINTQSVTNISNQTNVPTSTVQSIVNKWNENKTVSAPVSETMIIDNASRDTNTEREKVREVVSQIKTYEKQGAIGETTINTISSQTGVPAAAVSKIVQTWNENKNPQTRAISQISQRTNIEKAKVREVMSQINTVKNEKVKEVLNQIRDTAQQTQSASSIITQVSQATQVDSPAIEQILQTWNQNISQNPNQIVNTITNNNLVSTSLNNSIANNTESVNSIMNSTGVEGPTIKNIAQSWNSALTQTQVQATAPSIAEQYVIEKTSIETNISKEKVSEVLREIHTHEKQGAVGSTEITNISSVSGVPAATVQSIVNTYNEANAPVTPISETQIIEQASQQTNLQKEKVREVISQIHAHEKEGSIGSTTINTISSTTGVPAASVQSIVNTYNEAKAPVTMTERYVVEKISHETQIEKEKISQVLREISTHEKAGAIGSAEITNISSVSGVPAAMVQSIVSTYNETKAPPVGNKTVIQIIESISEKTNLQKEKVREVLREIHTHEKEGAIGSTTVNNISSTSGVPAATIQNIITQWNEAKSPPAAKMSDTQIIEKITQDTHLEKEKVTEVLKQMTEMKKEKVRDVIKEVHSQVSKDKSLVRKIAKDHNIKEEEVLKIAEAQKAIVSAPAPAAEIEKKIALPSTVSIEDYEAVKEMWQKQYETGEIPVQENIQSRDEWVQHDTVFITNALNKLTSEDEEVRQQGLDDISYILPIFMINNFKGEELLVYLKAKLQAAKAVQAQIEREEAIKAELNQQDEDDKVEVSGKKAEEQEKTMEMEQSMTIDSNEEEKPEEGTGEGGAPPSQ